MNLFLLLILQFGIGFSTNDQLLSPEGCLSYQSAKITLKGRISRETFAGKPNFESIKDGDEPETYWILHLTKPICVNSDKMMPGGENSEKNVKDIQLVLDKDQYARYKDLLGKQVRVSGKIFHAISGHHHTNILMEIAGIKST